MIFADVHGGFRRLAISLRPLLLRVFARKKSWRSNDSRAAKTIVPIHENLLTKVYHYLSIALNWRVVGGALTG